MKIEKDEAESHKQYLLDEKNHQYIRCVDIYYIQSHRNVCTFYTKDQEFQQYTTLKNVRNIFVQILLSIKSIPIRLLILNM